MSNPDEEALAERWKQSQPTRETDDTEENVKMLTNFLQRSRPPLEGAAKRRRIGDAAAKPEADVVELLSIEEDGEEHASDLDVRKPKGKRTGRVARPRNRTRRIDERLESDLEL